VFKGATVCAARVELHRVSKKRIRFIFWNNTAKK